MVVNAVQWRQYFSLSALVLGVPPSVVASHADRQALANIGREVDGILSRFFSVGVENLY